MVEARTYDGMFHGFLSLIDLIPAGKPAFDDSVAALQVAFGRRRTGRVLQPGCWENAAILFFNIAQGDLPHKAEERIELPDDEAAWEEATSPCGETIKELDGKLKAGP